MARDFTWRRLYPVPFRVLAEGQKFGRWGWVSYEFTDPAHDGRTESQRVVPESIVAGEKLRTAERSRIACRLTRESTQEAEARGESLTLIKPDELRFTWKKKSPTELDNERRKHAALANQTSLLHGAAKPLEPCPYEFKVKWRVGLNNPREQTCDDWETSTAFARRCESVGSEEGALRSLRETYEHDYMQKGVRLALGTHSRRSKQWLLVGILRVDDQNQGELF